MKLRNKARYLVEKLITPVLLRYLAKDRFYRYSDVKLKIPAGVFHPGFFFSTKVMLRYLKSLNLKGKSVLELGAGSGLISIFAARQEAIVTSSDISLQAVENLRRNAAQNRVDLTIIHSDLFARIPQQPFDLIIINPPFYPAQPQSEKEHAWFCGENFEYFQRLFAQLNGNIKNGSLVLMVLSDGCQIERIRQISESHGYSMQVVFEKRTLWERNFVFQVNFYA